jgi:hypothetical protein
VTIHKSISAFGCKLPKGIRERRVSSLSLQDGRKYNDRNDTISRYVSLFILFILFIIVSYFPLSEFHSHANSSHTPYAEHGNNTQSYILSHKIVTPVSKKKKPPSSLSLTAGIQTILTANIGSRSSYFLCEISYHHCRGELWTLDFAWQLGISLMIWTLPFTSALSYAAFLLMRLKKRLSFGCVGTRTGQDHCGAEGGPAGWSGYTWTGRAGVWFERIEFFNPRGMLMRIREKTAV